MKRMGLALLLVVLLANGCAVGYNTTLFVTRSNVGLDVESTPPTAEISISRQEGVIGPAFERGQTPPVMASFRSHQNPFSRFFFGVESTFAGGDAAVVLAQDPNSTPTEPNSELCLSTKPVSSPVCGVDVSIPEKGAVRPFIFGTDTVLGLKIAWSGAAAQLPDTIRLGFNRREFACAPIFGTDTTDCKVSNSKNGTYSVRMPSFLAVLDSDIQAGTPEVTGVTWLQYIATGASATTLAKRTDVREVMMERMDLDVSSAYDTNDPDVTCIRDWLGNDSNRIKKLNEWWKAKGLGGYATLGIKKKMYSEQRKKFMEENSIQCQP